MMIRSFSEKHPVWFSILAFIFFWSFGLIPLHRLLIPAMHPYDAELTKDAVAQLMGAAGALIVGFHLGFKEAMGFSAPKPWKTVFLTWPLALFVLLNLPENLRFDAAFFRTFETPRPYILIGFALSVGLVEEILGRSLVCNVLLKRWGNTRRGIYRSAIVSAAIFGLAHIGNFFMYDYQPLATATQIVIAFSFGIFSFALFYRTGSIIPGIIFHALIDLAANLDVLMSAMDPIPPSERVFTRTPESALVSLVIIVPPLICIGFFMLRKAGDHR